MAAKQKKDEKIISHIADDDDAAESPVAIQKHRIVTEYAKTIPVDEIDEGAEVDDDVEPEPAASEPPDPIERILAEIGASTSNWTFVVDRLPNYHRDGAMHTRAKSIRCGTISITAEMLADGGFIDEIQTRWARPNKQNDFRLTVRKDNRIHSYLPVISLEPPDPEVIAKAESNNPQINFTMPQNENSLDSFLKQAEKLGRLREAMGWGTPAAAANNAASNEPLTTERALLHLVSQDGEVIDSFTSKLKNVLHKNDSGVREVGWMDLVLEAIKSDTLPKMIKEAKNLLLEVNHIQTPPQMVQAPDATAATTSEITSAPPPLPQPPPPEIQLLNFAITACAQDMPSQEAAERIESFAALNPACNAYLDMFVAMPPDAALQWLSSAIPQAAQIAQLPHAKQWIENLQKIFTTEEPIEETNEHS